MMIPYYIFAFYVFLLVCGAIWFYGRVSRTDKKKDQDTYEKEHRLFMMYQNVEDMLDGFEEYAEEAKSGIDERLGQVESLIESLRKEWESLREQVAKAQESKPVQAERQEINVQPAPAPIDRPEDIIQPAPDNRQPETVPEPAPKSESRADVEKIQKVGKAPSDKPKLKTPDLIQQYAEQGMSKEEIAKALGISKREVSLIMEIKKIQV